MKNLTLIRLEIKGRNFFKSKQILIVLIKLNDELVFKVFLLAGYVLLKKKLSKNMLALTTFLSKIEEKEIAGKLYDMRKMSCVFSKAENRVL